MKKDQTLISPKGEVVYANLLKPKSKVGEKVIDPTFDVTIALSGKEAEDFKALCEKLAAEGKAAELERISKSDNAKKVSRLKQVTGYRLHRNFKMEEDKEGNETGRLLFTFKNKAQGKNRKGEIFNVTINKFDAARKAVPQANPGRGSVLKVAFTPCSFANDSSESAGMTFRVSAVQIFELKEYKGASAEDYGFAQEEGYTAPEESSFPEEQSAEGTAGTSGKKDGDF